MILPAGAPSRYALRHEPVTGGLGTGEAIARAFGILEGAGICLGTRAAPDPETLAAHWAEICDLTEAQPFDDAFSSVAHSMRKVLRGLKRQN